MKNLAYIILLAIALLLPSCAADSSGELSDPGSAGAEVLSGSYANMLTIGDKLYVLGNGQLKTLSLANPENPEEINAIDISFDIESLFIANGTVFVGSPDGMFIYTLDGEGIPQFRSQTPYEIIEELQPCDPIVANSEFAFATLSTSIEVNNDCWRAVSLNELRVFDLENLELPVLINTVPMTQPKGVGLDGDHLFVCENTDGLRILDVSDPVNIEELEHFPGFAAYDVIPANGLLLVVGPKVLHQYDYTNINDVTKLSSFELQD